ncbi:MAG: MbnP family protein [Bacteroidota bacterium]
MIKKTAFLSTLLILLVAVSCNDDDVQVAETTSMEINFKAQYDGETLMTEKGYDYNGLQIKFSKFDFYVADAVLLQQGASGTEETEIRDISFVDLSFNLNNPDKAEEGVSIVSNNIEVGQYDGIRFGIGVPADLNRTDPNEYASEHPLALTNHYWAGWNSYIFIKLEGALDMDGNGTYEQSFVYHTGTDDVYFDKQFMDTYDLTSTVSNVVNVAIDVKELLRSDTTSDACDADQDGYLDLDVCFATHTAENFQIAIEIMNNFEEAISIQR